MFAPSLSATDRRGIALRLFLTCWLLYALHFATNTVREIYPALSLGDHLSFDVSEYVGLHPDIFELPGRGAFINNNPGASILGAIPYALARPVIDRVVARIQRARAASNAPPPNYDTIYPMAREFFREAYKRGLDVKFGLAAGVMQAFLMAPLAALSVVVMFFLLASRLSVRAALWLSLLYGFATPILYRTAQLNQNVLISHCALFAFALLWRPWDDSAHPTRPLYLLAGLLCGWAVVLDYSGLVVVFGIGVYVLLRWRGMPAEQKSLRELVEFGAGVVAAVMVLFAYQWLAFGNPFLPAQHYMPPTPYSVYGFNGMDLPQLDLLWDTTFGIRFGLFLSAPILLLAFYLPGWLNARKRIVGSREIAFILLFTIALFLFASANQFGRLQFNSGVRYVVPASPFLFLLAATVLVNIPRALAIAIGIVTTYWSWCLAMYRDVEQGLGVFESIIHITREGLRLPWLTTLERMGYISSGPVLLLILILTVILIWAIWNVHLPLRVPVLRMGRT